LNSATKYDIAKNREQYRDLYEAIKGFDFYPTPPDVALHLYKKVIKTEGEDARILDIGSGLGALSIPFIKSGKFNKLFMVEINRSFQKYLKCFEAIEGVKVAEENIFEIPSEKFNVDTIITNPPFDGTLYLKFILKAVDILLSSKDVRGKDLYLPTFYVICPSNFPSVSISKKTIVDFINDDNINNKWFFEDILQNGNFKVSDIFRQIDNLGDIKGFKGMNNRGNIVDIKVPISIFSIII